MQIIARPNAYFLAQHAAFAIHIHAHARVHAFGACADFQQLDIRLIMAVMACYAIHFNLLDQPHVISLNRA